MTAPPPHSAVHPDLALAVFLEPLASGKRILWIGDPQTAAPQHLSSAAKSVRVLDTSMTPNEYPGLKVKKFRAGPLGFKRGSFDLVVVPDTEVLGDELGSKAMDLARMVGTGLVVCGVHTEDDDVEVDALRQHLEAAFEHLRILGQASMNGSVLADVSASDPEVIVDGSLVNGAAPERVVAIASQSPAPIDEYAIIQFPSVKVDHQRVRQLEGDVAERSREVLALREELSRAERRMMRVQSQLKEREGELSEVRANTMVFADSSAIPLSEDGAEQAVAEKRPQKSDRRSDSRRSKKKTGKIEAGSVLKTEVDELSKKLADQGTTVSELRLELERRAALVRDLVEELRSVAETDTARSVPTQSAVAVAPVAAVAPKADAPKAKKLSAPPSTKSAKKTDPLINEEVANLTAKLSEQGQVIKALRQESKEHTALVRDVLEHSKGADVGATKAVVQSEAVDPHAAREVDRLQAQLRDQAQLIQTLRGDAKKQTALVRDVVEDAKQQNSSLSPDAAADVATLEEKLAHQGKHSAQLKEELSRRDAMLRDLTELLNERPQAPTDFAEALAESEARLVRASFEIDSLRSMVEASPMVEASASEDGSSEDGLTKRLATTSARAVVLGDNLQKAQQERDEARAKAMGVVAHAGALESQLEGLRRGYETRIALLASEAQSPNPSSLSAEAALGRLKGERDGLRFRVKDREQALVLAQGSLPITVSVQDALDLKREESSELRAQNSELHLQLSDLTHDNERLKRAASDRVASSAAKDALITRLQMDLAEFDREATLSADRESRLREECNRLKGGLVDASTLSDERDAAVTKSELMQNRIVELEKETGQRVALLQAQYFESKELADSSAANHEALSRDINELKVDLTNAQVRFERAEAEADRLKLQTTDDAAAIKAESQLELESLRRQLAASDASIATINSQRDGLQQDVDQLKVTLNNTREILRELLRDEDSYDRTATEITAVGDLDAPTDGVGLEEQQTMVRTLTAQLEERNMRIRTLEKRVSSVPTADGYGPMLMRREMLELQERASRLAEELLHARQARRAAEGQLEAARSRSSDVDELSIVQARLIAREKELTRASAKVQTLARDTEALRKVCGRARQELQAILADPTVAGDSAALDKLGRVLSHLSNY